MTIETKTKHVALHYSNRKQAKTFFLKILDLQFSKTFNLSKELSNEIFNINENEIKKQISDTRNNLIQAITGETFEFKNMYKGFVKNAKKEHTYLAEYSFSLARKAEKVHSKLYINYLKQLDKNENFEPIDIYVCKICGNVELREPPNLCPNCEHDQKFFIKIQDN